MFTTPSPRPWMPLRRRRADLALLSSGPGLAAPALRKPRRRRYEPVLPEGVRRALRALVRRTPDAFYLKLRLDELSADAEAHIAEMIRHDKV